MLERGREHIGRGEGTADRNIVNGAPARGIDAGLQPIHVLANEKRGSQLSSFEMKFVSKHKSRGMLAMPAPRCFQIDECISSSSGGGGGGGGESGAVAIES
jgi:hypothetical protein